MKLKYYLRGLGIGIIFTAVILMIASAGKKDSLSNEEIIERARELGMVMAEETGEETQEEDAQKEEEQIPGETKDSEKETAQADKPEADQSEKNQPEDKESSEKAKDSEKETAQADKPVKEEAKEQDKEDNQGVAAEPVVVTVEINKGEYSDRISAKLLEAGLITDADDFNKYLTDTGVDGNIAVGQHLIPQGANYEEIAKILCEKPENQ